LAHALGPKEEPSTSTADQSLEVARGPRTLADPPQWFGVIRPSRRLGAPEAGPGARPTANDRRLKFELTGIPEGPDGDEEEGEESKILKLFENPLFNSNTLADWLYKLFGGSRSPGDGAAGGGLPVRSIGRVDSVGPNARPLPIPLRFTTGGTPGSVVG